MLRLITPIQTYLQNAINGLKTEQADIDVALQLVDEWGRGFVAETDYRLTVLYRCRQLELLDDSIVTPLQRADAVQLFEAKKIVKKMAFGSRLFPWDKMDIPPRGTLSGLEADLLREFDNGADTLASRLRALVLSEVEAHSSEVG